MYVRLKPLKRDRAFRTPAEIDEMVEQFEECRLPYEQWTHRAHLAVAVAYLSRMPLADAIDHARDAIQRYNIRCGDPAGYHETLTLLFLRWVDRRLREGGTAVEVVDEMARTSDMQRVLEHYSPRRLWSAEARAGWVEPDLLPL